MSRKIIAVVKLAPGQAGYYDQVSGVYLTTVNRIANVYQGMNTTKLQQAVKQKRIIVVSGSLKPIQPFNLEQECVVQKTKAIVVAKEEEICATQEKTSKLSEGVEEIKPVATKKKSKKATKEVVVEEVAEVASEEVKGE